MKNTNNSCNKEDSIDDLTAAMGKPKVVILMILYLTMSYLNSHHQKKIVQSVSFVCQNTHRGRHTTPAVGI